MTIIQDEWIEHDGGECPVAPGTLVDWRLRKGREFSGLKYPRFRLDWAHDPETGDNDIVAYKVVKEGEGG